MSTEQAAKVEAKGENKDGQVADEAGTQPASSAHKGATDHTHTRKRKQSTQRPAVSRVHQSTEAVDAASSSVQRPPVQRLLDSDTSSSVPAVAATAATPAVAAAAATPAVAAAAATVAAAAAVLRTAVATHAVATEDEHGLTEDEQLQIDRDLLDECQALLEESEQLMIGRDPTPTDAADAAAGAPCTQPTTQPAAMPRTSPPRSMYRSRSSRPRTSPPWTV